MSFDIKLEREALKKAQFLLQNCKNGFETAVSRAINRSLTLARTQASKLVREDYTVKARTVNKTYKLKKASKSNLEGTFLSKGPTLGAHEFKFTPKSDTTGAKRRAVKLTIRKDKEFSVQRGFVHQKRIYQRKGKERYPIKTLTGPAVPQMIGSETVMDKLSEQTQEAVEKRLSHEVEVVLKGFDKK